MLAKLFPMSTKTKNHLSHFRVLASDKTYCTLNTSFHELGVLIPGVSQKDAHVFTNLNGANNAIKRTSDVKQEVTESMISDFKGFDPLRFTATLEAERFWPE